MSLQDLACDVVHCDLRDACDSYASSHQTQRDNGTFGDQKKHKRSYVVFFNALAN